MNLNISTCVILLKKKRRKYEKGGRIGLRDSQIGGQASRQGGLGSIFRQKLGDATLGGQDGEMVQRYDQPYCLGLEQIWQGLCYPLQVGSWDYLLKRCLCLLEQKLGIIRTTLWDTINHCLKLNWNWWGLHWLYMRFIFWRRDFSW